MKTALNILFGTDLSKRCLTPVDPMTLGALETANACIITIAPEISLSTKKPAIIGLLNMLFVSETVKAVNEFG